MAGSVLIVDDDPAFRRLAVRLLTDAGLTVVAEADTAAAALAAARATRPDGVLVDLGLPDRDGRDLAAELTALAWAPRVLLTSAHADGGDAGAALPFVPKDLLPSAPLPALLGSPPPG
jgi:two-component system nitrate/nitrite response regulator NarL